MKVKLGRNEGYALLVVMLLVAVSLLAFSSVARWTSSTSMVNDRNNVYNQAVAAAEAGTERALSYMARDFFRQSFDPANARLYGSLVPTNAWAQDYEYSDGAGAINRIWVDSSPKMVLTNLDSQFAGLYGLVYNCT